MTKSPLRTTLMATAASIVLLQGTIVSTPTSAAKIEQTKMIELQAAMMDYIEYNSIDGKFIYFDAKGKRVVRLFPANLHPVIVKMGKFFILCADFKNASGNSVNVDFLAGLVDGDYRIYQAIIDNRDALLHSARSGRSSPCGAKNPCAAKNPCRAINPCGAGNPCAARNPCGAGNPCAAKKAGVAKKR